MPATSYPAARQPPARSVRLAVALAAACLLAAGAGRADSNLFATGHDLHVISDPRSGLALFGYDPVAFHVERRAMPGSPRHESTLGGLVWRFTSAANKAAFDQDPKPYMPLFGGHDGAGVADGVMVDADPDVFALIAGRLVLFRDAAARDRFAADEGLRRKALQDWPEVVRRQAGH